MTHKTIEIYSILKVTHVLKVEQDFTSELQNNDYRGTGMAA